MVRKIIFMLFIMSFSICCIPTKNELGRPRATKNRYFGIMPQDRFSIKPKVIDASFYNIIDTASFYKKIIDNNRDYFLNSRKDTIKYESVNLGFKFYKNGRVAFFRYVDLDDIKDINPQKADMGYYEFKDGKLYIEMLSYHVQSGYVLTKYKLSNIEGNKLYLISWRTNNQDVKVYRKQQLPKEFLIYKPDW